MWGWCRGSGLPGKSQAAIIYVLKTPVRSPLTLRNNWTPRVELFIESDEKKRKKDHMTEFSGSAS